MPRYLFRYSLLILVASLTCSRVVAQEPGINDPDFLVQGEYVGEVNTSGGKQKLGVRVAALGDGKFFAMSYGGGLPGNGWDKRAPRKSDFQTVNGVSVFKEGEYIATIKDNKITIADATGTTLGELAKILRQSPTIGAKPPAGAVVLFDGSSADQFENGRITDDGLLKEGTNSKRKFHSGTLHLEFREPADLKDAQRGNSGCYLQGRYEIQIVNSFGFAWGDEECASIPSIKVADVNMCFPPYSWQTYDIDFTAAEFNEGKKTKNARVTVRHNGVVVQNEVELPRTTPAAVVTTEGPEPGPLHLQDHSSPVRFRNIWFLEKN
jgi:hypothetical protein